MTHQTYNFSSTELACEAQRRWPYFLLSILITFLASLLLATLHWVLCGTALLVTVTKANLQRKKLTN